MSRSLFVLFLNILIANCLTAQVEETQDSIVFIRDRDTAVFVVVEQMPVFPGGDKARVKYLSENIQYPVEARNQGIEGTVFISFVVETDGSISNVHVLKGVGGELDKEAIRVVSGMPPWVPGKQRGKPVRVRFNMPIQFKLSVPGNKAGSSANHEIEEYEVGMQNMHEGLFDEAIKCMNKSIKNKESNYKNAYFARGVCHYELGAYDPAMEDIRMALGMEADLDPIQVASVLYLIANEYFIRQDLHKAIEAYTLCTELDPINAKAWNNRGLAYYRSGEAEKAKKDWKKAAKLGFDITKNTFE